MKIDVTALQNLANQVTGWKEGLNKSFIAKCTEEVKTCGLSGDIQTKVTELAESSEELQKSMVQEVEKVVENVINFVADINGFDINAQELFANASKKLQDASATKITPQRGRNFTA